MLKYQKFQAPFSKRDVLSKKDQLLWFMQKPHEKLLNFVIILLWEVIYVHFYNWDRSLDWVLVVYELNWSLKFHSGLRTIPHLVLTYNTQDFDSINAYLICVIVHVQMWCVCSITCRSNPKKIFECFIYFWKWFYTFVFLVFVQNAFLCFSSKAGLKAVSREGRDLELPAKSA